MSFRRRGSRSSGTEEEDVQDPPKTPFFTCLPACTQPIPFSQWLLMMLIEFGNVLTAHLDQKRTKTTFDSLTGLELKAVLKPLVTLILL